MKNQVVTSLIAKYLSESMNRRVAACGSWLKFLADGDKGKLKLHQAYFCKNRFCPMCEWRKAQKDALKISAMMDYLVEERKYAFIFVTLTAPSVPAEALSGEITRYNKAFKNLCKREEIARLNLGYVRKLEITHNPKRNDYHPHFHCVFAVRESYFKDKTYLSQAKWLRLWRDVMGDENITQVDVRRVKLAATDDRDNTPTKSKAVKEIAKYASKDSDYTRSEEVFDVFYRALKGRQVITFNGAFKEAVAMFKAGELNEYIKRDCTQYVYMLFCLWGKGQYIEQSCRKLDDDERRRLNGNLLDADETVE